MHDRPDHIDGLLSRRRVRSQSVQAMISEELLHRRNFRFLRLSHQAFRKRSLFLSEVPFSFGAFNVRDPPPSNLLQDVSLLPTSLSLRVVVGESRTSESECTALPVRVPQEYACRPLVSEEA